MDSSNTNSPVSTKPGQLHLRLHDDGAKLFGAPKNQSPEWQVKNFADALENDGDQYRYWFSVAAAAGKVGPAASSVRANAKDIDTSQGALRDSIRHNSAMKHAAEQRFAAFPARRREELAGELFELRAMDESHTAHRIAQWQAENRVVHEILIGTIVRFDPVAEALSIVRQAAEDVRAVDAGGAGRRPHDAQIATVEDAQEACAASLVRRLRCYVGGDLILALARWETSNHGATGDWIIRARNLVDDFANIATGRRGGDRALLARFTVAVRVSAAEIGNRIYVLGEGQNRRVINSACPDVVALAEQPFGRHGPEGRIGQLHSNSCRRRSWERVDVCNSSFDQRYRPYRSR